MNDQININDYKKENGFYDIQAIIDALEPERETHDRFDDIFGGFDNPDQPIEKPEHHPLVEEAMRLNTEMAEMQERAEQGEINAIMSQPEDERNIARLVELGAMRAGYDVDDYEYTDKARIDYEQILVEMIDEQVSHDWGIYDDEYATDVPGFERTNTLKRQEKWNRIERAHQYRQYYTLKRTASSQVPDGAREHVPDTALVFRLNDYYSGGSLHQFYAHYIERIKSPLEDVMTSTEVAEEYGISDATVRQTIARKVFGHNEVRKSKGTWLITRAAAKRMWGSRLTGILTWLLTAAIVLIAGIA